MSGLQTYLPVIGRILISIIFLVSGVGKIMQPDFYIGYMEAFGVPGILIWPTIVLEIVGGVLLIIGYQTRWAAAALALFTLVSGLIFHTNFADPNEQVNFMKNLAMVGGFLYVIAYGAGAFSVDNRSLPAGVRAGA